MSIEALKKRIRDAAAERQDGPPRSIQVITDYRDNLAARATEWWKEHGHDCRLSDVCRTMVRWTPEYVDGTNLANTKDAFRAAVSNPDVSAAFGTVAGTIIVTAFTAAPRNSEGWTRRVPVLNFRDQTAVTVDGAGGLTRHVRGNEANHFEVSMTGTNHSIRRETTMLTIDEQTAESDEWGAVDAMFQQAGRAAAAKSEDVVFNLMLKNPTLADTGALFNSTAVTTDGGHANLGTGALDAAALAAARAAIGSQILTDQADDPTNHLNLVGSQLLVPPSLEDTAIALAYARKLGNGRDIEVRSESRLSSTGVIDPDSEVVRTGTNTNWMLAANADAWPCILVGGPFEPKVRQYALGQGQWGLGIDVVLDIGAVVVDFRGLYWSTGAGA